MYITRKHISRRTALRGVGVTLALPWLEAMMPAQTPIRRSAAQPGTRFCERLSRIVTTLLLSVTRTLPRPPR